MAGKPEQAKPRDVGINIRLLASERAAWQRAAKRAGVGMSAWLRNLANAASGFAPPKRKDPK